ncbi:MAG: response regulator transcription factor [Cellulomonas iranensis]|uniref:DNA-binding NarL/FixJ family response regulator n=1 Tax=Cellulomonas iranensis TaxID=76862 RepID=A0ABU0GK55_9CELL|nr:MULTISPECIES: response regulator transcription factor [Cellulomonas]KSW30154.1 two-component system response regulator [Cellulomonas sp. B6]MBO9568181.1 response regulator transcription factor [Cellulomonas iranensis]MDQ0425750.1 DNA-binding NarL/FixJ family response regulator [Cellulomonas iranensis]UCN15193.1 response regulator transcription factor [Cellulomonas iranensis]
MIRVVLVDDQAVVRAGFRVLLEDAGDIEVVGQAASGPEAVDVVARTRPDVVCMDVRMPGGDGLTATRRIVADRTGDLPAVLVVTTFDLDEYVFGALEAGADGFVLKDADPADLADAIRRLARGDGMLDQTVTRRVIAEFARRRPAPPPGAEADLLTPRETDIVRLLAQGMSNAEIADALFVEQSTVKSHLGRAMTKLGTRDRLQTVVWAYRTGLAAPTR